MYGCLYVCLYVCTYVRTYVRMYVRTYVRMYLIHVANCTFCCTFCSEPQGAGAVGDAGCSTQVFALAPPLSLCLFFGFEQHAIAPCYSFVIFIASFPSHVANNCLSDLEYHLKCKFKCKSHPFGVFFNM